MSKKKIAKDIFSPTEISKRFGLSPKGLHYYEENAIIAPQRNENGTYRYYTLEECVQLHRAKICREYGFTINETAELLKHTSGDHLFEQLGQKIAQYEQEITRITLLNSEIARIQALIGRILRHSIPFEVVENPEFIRYPFKNSQSVSDREEDTRLYQTVHAACPFVHASLSIAKEHVPGASTVVSRAFLTTPEAQKRFSLPESNAVRIPTQKCIYTIICGEDSDVNSTERFVPALNRLRKEGFELSGDPFTSMITTFDNGEGMLRYDEAWFPII